MSNKEKVVVVLSGGQDSTTCLFWAKAQGFDIHTVTFDYGQRHSRELDSAMLIAGLAGVDPYKVEVITLGPVLKGTSPLVSDAKLEQYDNHNVLPGGLEKTFVPMRNQMFLTIAANRAYCIGASKLITGVCEEDFGGYPDCRRSFIDAFERASSIGTFNVDTGYIQGLEVITPLMKMTKAESVHLALDLPGCYAALAYSHTAYDGQYPPTGNDHATLLRAKGFEQAGVPDPLVLRAVQESRMAIPDAPNYTSALNLKYADIAGLI